jgi:hypothetical protein
MPANEWKTAKELGVAPATLTAMVRRNYAKALDTSPKTYCRIKSSAAVLAFLLEKYKSELTNFIGIHRCNEELSMLCSTKNGKVFDCYGNLYDIAAADIVRIGHRYFSLVDGKEIV